MIHNENPKRCYGQNKGRTPYTRMATASILRDALTKARIYMSKKESGEAVYDDKCEIGFQQSTAECSINVKSG